MFFHGIIISSNLVKNTLFFVYFKRFSNIPSIKSFIILRINCCFIYNFISQSLFDQSMNSIKNFGRVVIMNGIIEFEQ